MSTLLKPLILTLALGLAAPAFAQSTDADTTADTAAPADTGADADTPADTAAGGAADAGTAANDDGGIPLSMGETEQPEPEPGQTYIAENAGDWEIRCVKLPAESEKKDPCQLYQLLKDQAGNAVAEINIISLPEGSQAAAGANVVVPLETLLTERLSMSVDGGKVRKYPFAFCSQVGCLARLGFGAPDLAAFKRGNAAKLVIVPAIAPDQTVDLSVSLTGFTAGFDRLKELSAQ